MSYEPQRTVSVSAGAYATVRAIEKARRIWGPHVTVAGIIAESNGGRRYVYEVVRAASNRGDT